MILLPTRLPSKGYLYESEDFICKKKRDTSPAVHIQNNGHLYRTQSTVYLIKSSSIQGFWIISIVLKKNTKPLDPDGRTRIYRKQTKLFVAVLFMWSLHCASLYYVLI